MLNFFKNKKSNTASTGTNVVNTVKTPEESRQNPFKVNLEKSKKSLETKVSLLKTTKGVDLGKHHAQVVVVLDYSGSMYDVYYNGSVQATLTRLLPLALRFDDDGLLDIIIFDNSYKQLEPMSKDNYQTYVQEEVLGKNHTPNGGTKYAPAINATIDKYCSCKTPTFVIFITDGENFESDKPKSDAAITQSSKYKIFYQFIGIGHEKFEYLEKLDNLSGRSVDNTGFTKVSDFANLSDDQLYALLLEQYCDWLKAMGIN